MSHLAGWCGTDVQPGALERMAAALNAMSPVTEEAVGEGFALATKQPGMAGEVGRIAVSPDGKVAVAFAGYLYDNDLSIASDPARHCLERYEQEGTRFAGELNGTWALVVADERSGHLHLITDRLASRPIYYAEGQPLLFATRAQAILDFPGFSADVNPERLVQFLWLRTLPGYFTLCDQVMQVPSATVLTWDGRASSLKRYWSPQATWREDASVDECGDRIAGALRRTMGRICARTERPAMMLSGGMDSRAVATASPVPLRCYTMHLAERNREVATARRVAQAMGHEHRFVQIPEDHPLELLDVGGALGDGMVAYHHSQAHYLADALAEDRPQVLLGGWMLDTLFSGRCLPLVPRKGLAQLLPPRLLPPSRMPDSAGHWMARLATDRPEALRRLCGCDPTDLAERTRDQLAALAEGIWPGSISALDLVHLSQMPNMIMVSPMPDVPTADHFTAAGLPAYDNEMMEAMLATPPTLRHRHIAYARALTILSPAAARIPNANTGIPLTWPTGPEYWAAGAVRLWRAAMRSAFGWARRGPNLAGSWPNIGEQMATRPEWHEELRARARTSRLVQMGVVNRDGLDGIIEEQITHRANHWGTIGAWLTLEVWLERNRTHLEG